MSSRITGLQDELNLSQIQSLLNSLELAIDSTNLSKMNKVKLKLLFTEAIVENDQINYLAMTPKSFYLSVMTEVKKGIGRLSTNQEVTDKTGDGLLLAAHQALMQAQWKKDLFVKNGENPGSYYSNTSDLSTAKALAFPYTFFGTVPVGGTAVGPYPLPAGRYYAIVYFTYVISSGGVYSFGSNKLVAGAVPDTEVFVNIGNNFAIDLYDGGQSLWFFSLTSDRPDVAASFSFNAVLK